MWKRNKLLRNYGKNIAMLLLVSLLMPFPMFAEPLTEQQTNLSENGMRLYTDLEVDLLIDEISEAALEAIEQAAGEAAKAAVLAMVEREAAAMREASHQQAEALHWRIEADIQAQAVTQIKRNGVKNMVITGLTCFLGGLAVGIGGTLIIGGR